LMLFEELLERFLLVQPGRRFCDICLAKMLSAPIDDMRSAAERLRATPGFTSAAGQGFNCDRPRTRFGFPALRPIAFPSAANPRPPSSALERRRRETRRSLGPAARTSGAP